MKVKKIALNVGINTLKLLQKKRNKVMKESLSLFENN